MNQPPRTPGEDRRKHKRAADIFMVTYRLKAPLDVALTVAGKEFAAVAVDIAEGGVGVEVSQKLPVAAVVQLQFRLVNHVAADPNERQRHFELEGECRHCEINDRQAYHAGILFKNASARDRRYIADYVKDQALAKYE